MNLKSSRVNRSDGDLTRIKIKQVAQKLFATKGVNGVSIKDIIDASEQKNKASIYYHFGNKESLIAELLIDGAQKIDANRQQFLDKLLSEKKPLTIRKLLEALIYPVNEIIDSDSDGSTYIRFFSDLQLNNRQLMRDILGNKWNTGYRRCLKHLEELSQGIPTPILEQRLSMIGIYSNAIFATKEAAIEASDKSNRFWSHPYTIENIIDTLESMLSAPISTQTKKLM
jgi:AcrR family transcriptional regulator